MKSGLNKDGSATPTLADLPRWGSGRVRGVDGQDDTAARLRELGFAPGTVVHYLRRAPFGGPLVFELRGCQLCLRPGEARRVAIEPGSGGGRP